MDTEFLLKWHNHKLDILTVFEELLLKEAFVDVTLACEDFSLKAHKIVLSACSPFFQKLFLENPCKHPVIFLKDVHYADMKSIVEFMYKGETFVPQQRVDIFLKTARSLKVIGLTIGKDVHKYVDKEKHEMNIPLQSNSQDKTVFDQEANQGKRNSQCELKTATLNILSQSISQINAALSLSAITPHPQERDGEPPCKRSLLNNSQSRHSSPKSRHSSTKSSNKIIISENVNLLKNCKANHESNSSEVQEVKQEKNTSDCQSNSQQEAKTCSLVGITLDQMIHKTVEDSLPRSPDVHSSVSSSSLSLSEKNMSSTTPDEIQEVAFSPAVSCDDGEISKLSRKSPKRQEFEQHDTKEPSDQEPSVIYERINLNQNNFVCDVCGRTFPHIGYLKLHMRRHSGERPWTCEVCNKAFMQFAHLIQHQKDHVEQNSLE